MGPFQNRFIAALCALAAIVASVFIGTGLTLTRERAQIQNEYTDVYLQDVQQLRNAADALLTLAQPYAAAAQLPDRAALQQAGPEELESIVTRLDVLLSAEELSFNDAIQHRWQVENFLSYLDILKRSGYPTRAEQFNRKLDRFPISLIAMLAGIDPLPI